MIAPEPTVAFAAPEVGLCALRHKLGVTVSSGLERSFNRVRFADVTACQALARFRLGRCFF